MLNQLSPAYLLPEGNWFNLSYDSITSVSWSLLGVARAITERYPMKQDTSLRQNYK